MVRTADMSNRVSGAKSSRKGNASQPRHVNVTFPSTNSSSDYGGLNPICQRETPAWQKPITNFFKVVDKSKSTVCSEAVGEPSTSTAASTSNEVNIMREHEFVEAMEAECQGTSTEIIDEAENKENNYNGNVNGTEIKEVEKRKSRSLMDDIDYVDTTPRKKMKLNTEMLEN